MAKIDNLDEALETYGSDGGEYFKLENDKDCEVVRFLHEGQLVKYKDWFVLHKVEIDNRKRYVQCTEEDDCVACGSGNKPQVELRLQMVTKRDGRRKIWERGKTFVPIIKGLIAQYGDLCNRPYEIERNGKANDRNTTYEFFPLDCDDKRLEDIPVEPMELIGSHKDAFILDLSYEDMEDVMRGRFRFAGSSSGRDERGSDRGGRDSGRGSDRGRDSGRGSDRGRERDRSGRGEREPDRNERSSDRGRESSDRGHEREERGSRDEERGSSSGRGESSSSRTSGSRRERTGSEIF